MPFDYSMLHQVIGEDLDGTPDTTWLIYSLCVAVSESLVVTLPLCVSRIAVIS